MLKVLKYFLSGDKDGGKEEAWKDLEPQTVVLECLGKDKGIVGTLVGRTFSEAQIWELRESFPSSENLIAIITIQEECCILKIGESKLFSS